MAMAGAGARRARAAGARAAVANKALRLIALDYVLRKGTQSQSNWRGKQGRITHGRRHFGVVVVGATWSRGVSYLSS